VPAFIIQIGSLIKSKHTTASIIPAAKDRSKLTILATTIELYIEMIEESKNIDEFKIIIDKMTKKMIEMELKDYCDYINNYHI